MESELSKMKCRICLDQIDIAVSIFGQIYVRNENIAISNMVMSCASVQISDDDSYPNNICTNCLEDAKTAYIFKHKCEETEQLLKKVQAPALDLIQLVKVEEHESLDDYVEFESDDSLPLLSIIGVKTEVKSEENASSKSSPDRKTKKVAVAISLPKRTSQHRRGKDFDCDQCDKKYAKITSLKKHILRKHKGTNNNTSHLPEIVNYDLSNSQIDATINFKCCQCEETFENEEELDTHKKIHTSHTSFKEKRTNDEKDCTLQKNVNNSTDKKSHKCKHCFKIYPSKALLGKHLTVCREKSLFQCFTCHKEFLTSENLLEHRKVHRAIDCKYCGLKVVRKLLSEHVSNTHSGPQLCIECNKLFETFDLLEEHYKTHESFSCKDCESVVNDITVFNTHLDSHAFEKLHPESNTCINCEKKCSDRKQLLRHYTSHSEFSCNECDQNFNSSINLLKHAQTHETDDTSLEQRTCLVCRKQFKNIENMWKHRATHNSNKSETIYCPYCDYKPESKVVLGKHMHLEHDSHKTFFCSICEKSFFGSRRLEMHMLIHTGEKRHVCEVCGRGFTLGGNLVTHMRTHTGEKPYKCEICGKSYTQSGSLKLHMVFHKPSNNHVCPECGMCFSLLNSLRSHVKRAHTSERPHECSVCQKAFKVKKDLSRHEKIHTGVRNYKCSYCGKAFGRNSNLKIHLKIHTGETPHVCTICGKGFIQLHVLRTHMNTHD